jgi:hypothetical protein
MKLKIAEAFRLIAGLGCCFSSANVTSWMCFLGGGGGGKRSRILLIWFSKLCTVNRSFSSNSWRVF